MLKIANYHIYKLIKPGRSEIQGPQSQIHLMLKASVHVSISQKDF